MLEGTWHYHRLVYSAQCFDFMSWFYLSLSVCPPFLPRPTAALLQISNELRLGVHVGSCYLATAVISHDSVSTRLPFFLFSHLLVRQQLFFRLYLFNRPQRFILISLQFIIVICHHIWVKKFSFIYFIIKLLFHFIVSGKQIIFQASIHWILQSNFPHLHLNIKSAACNRVNRSSVFCFFPPPFGLIWKAKWVFPAAQPAELLL